MKEILAPQPAAFNNIEFALIEKQTNFSSFYFLLWKQVEVYATKNLFDACPWLLVDTSPILPHQHQQLV